jgi:hypothetical protein
VSEVESFLVGSAVLTVEPEKGEHDRNQDANLGYTWTAPGEWDTMIILGAFSIWHAKAEFIQPPKNTRNPVKSASLQNILQHFKTYNTSFTNIYQHFQKYASKSTETDQSTQIIDGNQIQNAVVSAILDERWS